MSWAVSQVIAFLLILTYAASSIRKSTSEIIIDQVSSNASHVEVNMQWKHWSFSEHLLEGYITWVAQVDGEKAPLPRETFNPAII